MLFEDGKSEASYALIKIIASIQGGNKTVRALYNVQWNVRAGRSLIQVALMMLRNLNFRSSVFSWIVSRKSLSVIPYVPANRQFAAFA